MRRATSPLLPILLVLGGLVGACGGSTPRGSTPSGGESATYRIHLHRAEHAGIRYLLVAEATEHEERTAAVEGRVVENLDRTETVRLVAAVEVLEATEKGMPLRLRYQVQSCERIAEGTNEPLLREGQVVEVETALNRRDARVAIDGTPATDLQVVALRSVLTLTRTQKTADEVFGTTTPRAVGERWQPDFAALAEDLAISSPFRLDPSHMSGVARLVERRNEGPVAGLVVEARVDATEVGMGGMPPGTNVRRGEISMGIGGFFPLDASMPLLRSTTYLAVSLRMAVPTPDAIVDTTVNVRMEARRRFEPLP